MIYLQLEDRLSIADRVLGTAAVRDLGLLDAAVARPRASAFGRDAYRDIHEKAAALLSSLVRNRGLVDGNKRLGLAALLVFYRINGRTLTATNDDVYEFVMAIAEGRLSDVPEIATFLREHVRNDESRAGR